MKPAKGTLFLVFLMSVGSIMADNRLALVVGNGAYGGANELVSPAADASAVAEALQRQGWRVQLVTNADRRGLSRALAAWGEQLLANPSAQALFFFSGHGVSMDGDNFLLPVGTTFESTVDIKSDALSLASVSATLEASHVAVSLVVLDAARGFALAQTGSRSATSSRGLAVTKAALSAEGSAILYSTGPGEVVPVETGTRGRFASAFVKQIESPLPLEESFKTLTSEVRESSGGVQKPWLNASLSEEFSMASEAIRLRAPSMVLDPTMARLNVSLDPSQQGTVVLQARRLTEASSRLVPSLLGFLTVSQATKPLGSMENYEGEAVTLKAGVQSLGPGTWLLSARLQGDPEPAWYQVLSARGGASNDLLLPVIRDSAPIQYEKLQRQRETLTRDLSGAQWARGLWNTAGWIMTIPASLGVVNIPLYYLFQRPAAIERNKNIPGWDVSDLDRANLTILGGLVVVPGLLALTAFLIPTTERQLQLQLDQLDDQIAGLAPEITTRDQLETP